MWPWLCIEGIIHRKASALGFASGTLAGLVVITPAAAVVQPFGAFFLGTASSIACFYALQLKIKLRYDDTLDCFGIHGVGSGLGVTILLAGTATLILCVLVEKTVGFRLDKESEHIGTDQSLHGERGYDLS